MKIAIIVHHFLPHHSAGTEIYTLRLARWLLGQGHQVEVISIESVTKGDLGEIKCEWGTYEGIPVCYLSFNAEAAGYPWQWGYANPLIGEWFDRYFQESAPDLAHFQSGYLMGILPMQIAAEKGIPIVLTLHDYWYFCPQITLLKGDGTICEQVPAQPSACAWCIRLESRRYRMLDQFTRGHFGDLMERFFMKDDTARVADRRSALLHALELPDAVVVPSPYLLEMARDYVPDTKLHLSKHGTELDAFSDLTRPEPDGVIRFGFIGNISPHKGLHVLMQAFNLLVEKGQRAELHIYGGLNTGTDYDREIETLVRSNPRFTYYGKYDNGDAGRILSALDVLVIPSLWHEVGPLTMLEAFAAGTPVIASPLGNMQYLIQPGVNGLFFRPGDVDNLAQQMQLLIDAPGQLAALKQGVSKPRSIEDEMSTLMDVYRSVLKECLQQPGD